MIRNAKRIGLLAVGFFLIAAHAGSKDIAIAKENSDFSVNASRTFKVQPGGTVYLETSFGNISVESWDKEEVLLSVRTASEADNESKAQEFSRRFSLSVQEKGNDIHITVEDNAGSEVPAAVYHLNVPGNLNLNLDTDEGEIEIGDMEGNVTAESQEGGIRVGDIAGKLVVKTGGGSVFAGRIGGKTTVVSGGGGIRIAEGGTDVEAATGGGGIRVGPVTGDVDVKTDGGSIDIGRVDGDVSATTGGGDVNIGSVAGAIETRSGGGLVNIVAAKGDVKVSTGGGTIEIGSAGGAVTASTGGGDITVYLTEDFPATFDVELNLNSKNRRRRKRSEIVSDFPLDIEKEKGWFGGTTHTGTGKINGGGHTIRLSTVNSSIFIKK
ncbi:MAG: hypothetical protein GY866_37335, partial [Proteobacteria bacterium]|nr:hypothetical protein [Pseudomonadota bacterium]